MAVIAIDIDDVLIPFYASMADWHNQNFGTVLDAGQLTSNKLTSGWGLEESYWIAKCNDFHASGESAQIPLSIDAQQALTKLKEAKHEIVLVTSRPASHRAHTHDWMLRNVGNITQELLMCDDFSGKQGTFHMNKGEIAHSIGASFLIDDAPHYIESCEPTPVTGILFGDYTWNSSHHDVLLHAKSWSEALDIINSREL
jgi:uncharacterized HAD superfamily protein